MTMLSSLTAVSPIDGRYFNKTHSLSTYFSEYALIYYRLLIEIRWLSALALNPDMTELPVLDQEVSLFCEQLLTQFNEKAALAIKVLEKETNHDVKAVEYYLRDALNQAYPNNPWQHFIHFACTSEDINNLAYASMIKAALTGCIIPTIKNVYDSITGLGKQYARIPMLARTHGQAASPTTVGKEFINHAARLKRPLHQLQAFKLPGKCNGAIGNYNAHTIAYPDIDWLTHTTQFVNSLGLECTVYTTQIEPHDGLAELAHMMIRINQVLLNHVRDLWHYISLNYFTQKTVLGEVGSSTMPHKVNPIDFENAEGNLGLANTLFEHFATKLTVSRLQRDLSDSTVLRNIGSAFAYALIAYESILKGHSKLEVNVHAIQNDLDGHWDVLSEAIQTIMRRYHVPHAYEQLRNLTRGKSIHKEELIAWVTTLPIPEDAKQRLITLTPETYIGQAIALTEEF